MGCPWPSWNHTDGAVCRKRSCPFGWRACWCPSGDAAKCERVRELREDSAKRLRFIQHESCRGHKDNPRGKRLGRQTLPSGRMHLRSLYASVLIKAADYRFSVSDLQADDVASLPQLLWSEAALLFVSVLHSYVVLGVETFGLGLRERGKAEPGGKMGVIECVFIPILFLLCYRCCHIVVLVHATQITHIGRLVAATCI